MQQLNELLNCFYCNNYRRDYKPVIEFDTCMFSETDKFKAN